jgi:hypothetical protein
VTSIDVLPDEVLLEIFDIYLDGSWDELDDSMFPEKGFETAWRPLVHVCRRWRSVIFGSPCRLDLKLNCTGKTPARDTLDVWPALPISVWCDGNYRVENIIAVLERSDRVCWLELWNLSISNLEEVSAAMQCHFRT